MSILTMDMSSYEVDEPGHSPSQYDDEILCAGWIPDLALQQSCGKENRPAIPEALTALGADIFLKKLYSFQR